MTIVIPTYYYKPSNLTPVNRIQSWVDYFAQQNCRVIVVTRHWDTSQSEYQILNKPIAIEQIDGAEVHYLPYLGNKRTNTKNAIFRKCLTLFEQFFQNNNADLLPYKSIVNYTLKLVEKEKPNFVLISGNPFQLFKIGYLSNKKFGIKWLADYRDGWTVGNYGAQNESFLTRLINNINKRAESKWLKTASAFSTVSTELKNAIGKQINLNGHVIFNGFIGEIANKKNVIFNSNTLQLIYSGEIYELQNYKSLIEAVKLIVNKYGSTSVKLTFLGTRNSNHKIPDSLFTGFQNSIEITSRLPYNEALEIQERCDAFVMLNHQGMKGIASSKIFDYLKNCKPVILFKNDYDVLEELVTGSNLGLIANNEDELFAIIEQLVLQKQAGKAIEVQPKIEFINNFSRNNQAKKLFEVLKEL